MTGSVNPRRPSPAEHANHSINWITDLRKQFSAQSSCRTDPSEVFFPGSLILQNISELPMTGNVQHRADIEVPSILASPRRSNLSKLRHNSRALFDSEQIRDTNPCEVPVDILTMCSL